MKRSKTRGARTNAHALLFGIIFELISFTLLSLICAIIMTKTKNPTAHIGAIATCITYLTAAISGFATSRFKGEGGTVPAILACLFFSLVLFGTGLIMTKGHLPIITAVNLVAYMLIGAIFALFGKRRGGRRRKR